MVSDKEEGVVKGIGGSVQDVADAVLGDTGNQAAVKARELGGKAQQLYSDATDVVRLKATDSPLTTLGVAAGLGFLLGAIWAAANKVPSRSTPRRYRNNDHY
jgi:ElaB/YqjD/DUF883 family membrane-anchored ribosome-binding protein